MAASDESGAGAAAWWASAGLLLVGTGGLVGFSLGSSNNLAQFLDVFASAVLFALAAAASGAFFGFLFGVPRTLASTESGPAEMGASGVRANTNLEQVSDWLTKILIGATITQLGNFPSAAAKLFNAMAPALGSDAGDAAAFAGSIVIYFAVFGFLTGWLVTRLFLGQAMRNADATRLLATANAMESVDPDKAAELRVVAEELATTPATWPTSRVSSQLDTLIGEVEKRESTK
ncbi:MAG: hypothetical protein WD556_11590 [Actinomycetota bacterium]